MMPITPSGIRMRPTRSPFGRTRTFSTLPTGSGSAATSRSPASMSRHFDAESSRRFTRGSATPLRRASARSSALAARMRAFAASSRSAARSSQASFSRVESSAIRSEAARARVARLVDGLLEAHVGASWTSTRSSRWITSSPFE